MDIAQEILTTISDYKDLLKKVITGKESWVNIETKPQSSQWKACRRTKTEKSTSSLVKCEGFTHSFIRLEWRGVPIRNTTLCANLPSDVCACAKQKLLPIPKSAFQKCFEDWKKCCHNSITSEGDYLEGDKIVIDK